MEVPEAGPVPGLSNPIQPGQILSDHYLQHYTVLHVTSQNYRSSASPAQMVNYMGVCTSAANRLIGEVVQSRRRPLLGPSPG